MSHGVKHFLWRDGRPRWHPSPSLRSLGLKGKDLKDEDGNYLPLIEALKEARRLNAEADRERGVDGRRLFDAPRKDRGRLSLHSDGYIYFLWIGPRVKIGFSTNPYRRLHELRTGMSAPMDKIAVVKGSTQDERRLHKRLKIYHSHGEWFRADEFVNRLLTEIFIAGTANLP